MIERNSQREMPNNTVHPTAWGSDPSFRFSGSIRRCLAEASVVSWPAAGERGRRLADPKGGTIDEPIRSTLRAAPRHSQRWSR